jgi:acyl-CoA thioesterase
VTEDEQARACAAALWADDHASQSLGMVLGPVAAGRAELTMTVRADMANGHGLCHGGFIFALADSAMAFACNGYNQRMVAQYNSITYLRPARSGETLTAVAAERSRAGRGGIYDVRVVGRDGSAVAEFRGHVRSIGGTILTEG